MKKAMGIVLIILGIAISLVIGFLFINYMTLEHDAFVAKYAARGENAELFYKEGIDAHFRNGRIVTGITTLFGIGLIVVGTRLSRRKKPVAAK